jgi:hypothetical protein
VIALELEMEEIKEQIASSKDDVIILDDLLEQYAELVIKSAIREGIVRSPEGRWI